MSITREEQVEMSRLVYAYAAQRLEYQAALERTRIADWQLADALAKMQAAWRACAHVTPGIYSFKETGRNAVVVAADIDYPEFVQVIQ